MPFSEEVHSMLPDNEDQIESVADENDYSDQEDDYSDDNKGNDDYDESESHDESDDVSSEVYVEASNDSDRLSDDIFEEINESESQDSDKSTMSYSSSSGIIPVGLPHGIGHAVDDLDVMIMERVSPEPGM